MARTRVCAGNWKMNPRNRTEAQALIEALRIGLEGVRGVERVMCPPFVYLPMAHDLLAGSGIGLGAQNAHWEDGGAFTGEISPPMLDGLVEYVIVGHSERRTYFGESDETVQRRTAAVLRHGLRPITCVGETLEEREAGQTEPVLARQVRVALEGVDLPDGFILAYEPVWAIGTGRAATGAIAREAIRFIRQQVAASHGRATADSVRILYGGSVTAANAAEFLAHPDIDGALVGGASLKPDEFARIARVMAGE